MDPQPASRGRGRAAGGGRTKAAERVRKPPARVAARADADDDSGRERGEGCWQIWRGECRLIWNRQLVQVFVGMQSTGSRAYPACPNRHVCYVCITA